MRHTFATYDSGLIARHVSELREFRTYGNLSGRPDGFHGTYGREFVHPVWHEFLNSLFRPAGGKRVPEVLYSVYSYSTLIAVLIGERDHHGGIWRATWYYDAAASTHSTMTAKAVYSFLGAVGANGDGYYARHGSVKSLGLQVWPVRAIGEEWLIAQRLSPTQRAALGQNRGLPQRRATLAVLRREGLVDDRGFMTDLGAKVSRYCV